jgi:hypothetical protein
MIAFFLSPITRYVILGAAIIMVVLGIYGKIRADAVAEIEAAATADAIRRMENAVRAGDAVGTSPDKLRQSDGYARD